MNTKQKNFIFTMLLCTTIPQIFPCHSDGLPEELLDRKAALERLRNKSRDISNDDDIDAARVLLGDSRTKEERKKTEQDDVQLNSSGIRRLTSQEVKRYSTKMKKFSTKTTSGDNSPKPNLENMGNKTLIAKMNSFGLDRYFTFENDDDVERLVEAVRNGGGIDIEWYVADVPKAEKDIFILDLNQAPDRAAIQKLATEKETENSNQPKASLIGAAASAVATAVGNIASGALPAQLKASAVPVGSLPIAGPGAFLSYGRKPDLFEDSAEEMAERALRERLKEERKEAERRNEERKKGQSGPKPLNKKEETTKTVQTHNISLSIPGQGFFKDSELDLVERELADRLQEERMREAAEEVAKEAERKKQEEAVQQAHFKALQLLARLQRDSQDEVARNAAALRVQQAQMQAAHTASLNEALRTVIADVISNNGSGSSSSHDRSSGSGSSNDRERGDGGNWTSRNSTQGSGGSSSRHGNSSSGGSICLSSSCRDCHLGSRDSGGGKSWDGLGNK